MPYDPGKYWKQYEENNTPQQGTDWQQSMNDAQAELERSQQANAGQPKPPTGQAWARPQAGPQNQRPPARSSSVGGSTHRVANTTVGGSGNGRAPSSNAARVAAGGAAGVIGTPNLGSVSAMQQWAMQIDAMYGAGTAQRYLGQRGMAPTVNGQSALYNPANAGMETTPQDRAWLAATGGRGGMGGAGGSSIQQPNANGSYGDADTGSGLNRSSFGLAGGGGGGDLSGQIEQTYGDLMRNPSGFNPQQEQMLRNRAAEPIAAQQQQNMEDTQADAVRRGAASDNADIRDQLNRVSAQGAKDQGDASFNVDRALADLARSTKLSAAQGAGNYENQRREIEMLLAQLEQENNPLQAGLSSALGS